MLLITLPIALAGGHLGEATCMYVCIFILVRYLFVFDFGVFCFVFVRHFSSVNCLTFGVMTVCVCVCVCARAPPHREDFAFC
jgi:hypothetical protein